MMKLPNVLVMGFAVSTTVCIGQPLIQIPDTLPTKPDSLFYGQLWRGVLDNETIYICIDILDSTGDTVKGFTILNILMISFFPGDRWEIGELALADSIVNLVKRRGFVYNKHEIRGSMPDDNGYSPINMEMYNYLKQTYSLSQMIDTFFDKDGVTDLPERYTQGDLYCVLCILFEEKKVISFLTTYPFQLEPMFLRKFRN